MTKGIHKGIESIIKKSKENIKKHGYTVMSVFDDPVKGRSAITYTVGLTETYKHPEILVAGFHPEQAHAFLRWVVAELKQGKSFKDKDTTDRLFKGYIASFLNVRRDIVSELKMATLLMGDDVEVLQLVIPDANGLFPWQAGCDPQYVKVQQIFGEKLN